MRACVCVRTRARACRVVLRHGGRHGGHSAGVVVLYVLYTLSFNTLYTAQVWPFCKDVKECNGLNYGLANSMGLFLQACTPITLHFIYPSSMNYGLANSMGLFLQAAPSVYILYFIFLYLYFMGLFLQAAPTVRHSTKHSTV